MNKGFSIIELVIAVAVGGITSLVMATVFTFSAQQFQSLIDENNAEESLLLASYYLRASISQAVKTQITANDPSDLFGTVANNAYDPVGIDVGFIDTSRACSNAGCTAMGNPWTANVVNAFGIFFRENGGTINTATAPWTNSQFITTGIFYRPANGNQSGKLYIAQGPPGTAFTLTDGALGSAITFDKISAFGVTNTNAANCPASGAPYVAASCVNIHLRTRYFRRGVSITINYDPDPVVATTAGSHFRDVEMTINIGLRNNIIGVVGTGGAAQRERLMTGLYFYRFRAPSLAEF